MPPGIAMTYLCDVMDERAQLDAAAACGDAHLQIDAPELSCPDMSGRSWTDWQAKSVLDFGNDSAAVPRPAFSPEIQQQRDTGPLSSFSPDALPHRSPSRPRRALPARGDATWANAPTLGQSDYPPESFDDVPAASPLGRDIPLALRPRTSHSIPVSSAENLDDALLPSRSAYSLHRPYQALFPRALPPPTPPERPPSRMTWTEVVSEEKDQEILEARSYPPEELDTDFKRKYPPDKFGEEAADNARIWKVYRDEAIEDDKSMLNAWNKTLDILLIFAGLFSAVSTAFLIESYKLLQPDYTQYLADAVYVALTARNGSTGFSFDSVTLRAPSDFTSSFSAHWINGLWFTSLAISLSVSLLCILAKQWLDEYHSRVSSPAQSIRYWVRRRALYYEGLQKWQLAAFVSALPVLLHVSLFLFLAGLVVFLWQLQLAIAVWLLIWSTVVVLFYVGSIVLPMQYLACPSATPLVRLSANAWSRLLTFVLDRVRQARRKCAPFVQWILQSRSLPVRLRSLAWDLLFSLAGQPTLTGRLHARPSGRSDDNERDVIIRLAPALDADALTWLIDSSPSPAVVAVGMQAIGGFPPWSAIHGHLHERKIELYVLEHLCERFPDLFTENTALAFRRHRQPLPQREHADLARYIRCIVTLYMCNSADDIYYQNLAGGVSALADSAYLAIRQLQSGVTYDLQLLNYICSCLGNAPRTTFDTNRVFGFLSPRLRYRTSNTLLVLSLPQCSIADVMHVVDPDCIESLTDHDLEYLIQQVQHVLRAHQVEVRPDTLQSICACIELWCTILNRRDELKLDLYTVAAATRTLEKLIRDLESGRRVHSCRLRVCSLALFPQFSQLCMSQLQHLGSRLAQPAASLLAHLCTAGEVAALRTTEFWLAYVGLVHAGENLRQRLDGGILERGFFSAIAHTTVTACELFSADAADRRHAVSDSHALLVLQRDPGRRSAWHILHTSNQDLEDPWPSWFIGTLGKEMDGTLIVLANALAAQLCVLRRNGADVAELVDELFAMQVQRSQRLLARVAKALELPDDPYRQTFEHLVRCYTELSSTWWPALYHVVMTGEFNGDQKITTYAKELDEKVQQWTPCLECH